jgi:hypothetical protein
MALKDILFRFITKVGYTTKVTELTHEELDQNFENIIDHLNAQTSGAAANIEPYNGGTTYDPADSPVYVSYNGNVYLLIDASPVTGVVPDANPASWELTSVGALVHKQNSDTALDIGKLNEVTAAEIRAHLDAFAGVGVFLIEMDWTNYKARAAANALAPNNIYRITDQQYACLFCLSSSGEFTTLTHGGGGFDMELWGVKERIASTSIDIDLSAFPHFFALYGIDILEIDHTGAAGALESLTSYLRPSRFILTPKDSTTMDVLVVDSGIGVTKSGQFIASPSVAAATITLNGTAREYLVCEGIQNAFASGFDAIRVVEVVKEV